MGAPFRVAGRGNGLDDLEPVPREGFRGGPVGGVLGEGAQLVERLAVEVDECRAGEGVREEAGQAGGVAGREVPAGLYRCEKPECRPHGCCEDGAEWRKLGVG